MERARLLMALLALVAACGQQPASVRLSQAGDPSERTAEQASPSSAASPASSPSPTASQDDPPPASAEPEPSAAAVLPPDCPPWREPPPGEPPPDDLIEDLQRYAEQHPDTAAGLWLWGEAVRMAFTDELDEHQGRIDELARGRARVELLRARWTERHLRELQDRVTRGPQEYAGTRVTGIGVDIVHNRTSLILDHVDEQARREVARHWPPEQLCLQQGEVHTQPAPAKPLRTVPSHPLAP